MISGLKDNTKKSKNTTQTQRSEEYRDRVRNEMTHNNNAKTHEIETTK